MTTMLLQDLRYALRGFRRHPTFAAMAVLTLAVALAGNTAIFSVLDAAVLRSLPFPDAEELVFVNGVHRTADGEAVRGASWPEFVDWRDRIEGVAPLVGVTGQAVTLSDVEQPQRLTAQWPTDGYFELLGGEAEIGRTFTTDEWNSIDGPPVAVLSHGLWESAFGGDPAVVGGTIRLNGTAVQVVGVMPEDFAGTNAATQLWIPMSAFGIAGSTGFLEQRGSRFMTVMGRLAPGVGVESAQDRFEAIALQLQEEHPRAHEDRFARVQPFDEAYLGTTGEFLWILFGAGLLLLAIAAANVANLLLVRSHARTRELSVRRALGADGGRVRGQLLTESVALAAAGGIAGLLGSMWALEAALPLIPPGALPAYVAPEVSGRAFGFTLVVLTLVGIAAGLVPAWTSARRDIAGTLRGGRGTVTGRGGRAQKLFVVTQIGLALVLMVGAGLLTRSLRAQLSVDPGLDLAGIHSLRVQPGSDRYPGAEELRVYGEELVRAVASVPGVTRVALASDFPFRGGSYGQYTALPEAPEDRIRAHWHVTDTEFFGLLGVELLAGRSFTTGDDADSSPVIIVTRAFVERVWPDAPSPEAAVGRTLYVGNPSDPDNLAEVVGIVEDVRYRNLTQSMMDGPNSPDLFYPLGQAPIRTREVAFRVAGDTTAVLGEVRRAVAALDPETPPFALASLEALYRSQTAMPRLAAVLMGALGLVALGLAAVGIYGVLTFTVGQRGPEIALRRALGAQATGVARSVVVDAVKLAGVGIAVGAVVALASGGLLQAFLFEIEPGDLPTLLGTGVALLAISAIAAAIPATRAARKAPADALGGE